MSRKRQDPLTAVLTYIRNAEPGELKSIAVAATVELNAREPKQVEPRKRVKKADITVDDLKRASIAKVENAK